MEWRSFVGVKDEREEVLGIEMSIVEGIAAEDARAEVVDDC